MASDYYKILGVDKNASAEEVKRAYRELAHKHHPDKKDGNEQKFKEVNEAYQVLGNESKRRQYDQFGGGFNQAGGGFNYQDFSRAQSNPFGQGFNSSNFSAKGGPAYGWDFGDLGDIFSFFTGGGGSRGRRAKTERGRDLSVAVAIDFGESVYGLEKMLELEKLAVCDHCAGSGAEPGSKINTCPTCGGLGKVSQVQQTILGNFRTESVCPDCRGQGKTYEKKCHQCKGKGLARGRETIKVKIPAGIADGQTIKLSGQGEMSKQGLPGDLYLTIKVQPSKKFVRRGDDIFSQEHIFLKQAILGDKIAVETVDGPVSLKIPAGTQSQTSFRLRDKGFPVLGGYGRGDQLVEIIVDIPHNLSHHQRQLVEEIDF